MRISDWSSDVCSSDLSGPPGAARSPFGFPIAIKAAMGAAESNRRLEMANIGSFTKTANGFTGTIRTLALSVKANIVPDEYKASDAAPDYRVFSVSVQLGAACHLTAHNLHHPLYVSVKLADPTFPAPIYSHLVLTLVFLPFYN